MTQEYLVLDIRIKYNVAADGECSYIENVLHVVVGTNSYCCLLGPQKVTGEQSTCDKCVLARAINTAAYLMGISRERR